MPSEEQSPDWHRSAEGANREKDSEKLIDKIEELTGVLELREKRNPSKLRGQSTWQPQN